MTSQQLTADCSIRFRSFWYFAVSGFLLICISASAASIQSAQDLTSRGLDCEIHGKTSCALSFYDQAVKLDSKFLAALKGKGRVHFRQQQFILAISDFQSAYSIDSTNADSLVWLGLAKLRNGQDPTAEQKAGMESLQQHGWPMPMIKFLAGEIRWDEMMDLVFANPHEPESQATCQARFFLAEWELATNHLNEAVGLFDSAQNYCLKEMPEKSFAALEAKRLKKLGHNPSMD